MEKEKLEHWVKTLYGVELKDLPKFDATEVEVVETELGKSYAFKNGYSVTTVETGGAYPTKTLAVFTPQRDILADTVESDYTDERLFEVIEQAQAIKI